VSEVAQPAPDPEPAAEPEEAPAKQEAERLVLSKDADKDWWIVVGTYRTASAKAAIAAAVKEKKATAGSFVAVPARSWQPLTLALEEQEPKITLT
jgi:hypothetical protein